MVMKIKYRGNTLPEVMVALTLVSFCSTLAVLIYLNIQKSTMPFIKIKTNEIASAYLNDCIIKKDFFDNTYTDEEYTVKKTISRNERFFDCIDIRINVFDVNHKQLSELKATIHAE